MPPSLARSPGPISIRGRSARPAWSRPPSTNWRSAGSRSSTPSTRTASTSATRSTRARTCTTARPSRCSSSAVEQPSARQPALRPQPLRAAAARLPRLHRHLPRAHQDVPRQGRRVQSDRPAGRLRRLPALGRTAPGASARSATARSISRRSSRSSPSTTTTAGPCSNGNARSSTPSRARPRARRSSRATSSASPRRPSTISPAARHRSEGQPQDARLPLKGARTDEAWAANGGAGRRIRLGMVGGGQGAFIGAVHRIAARLDDHYELVAGALSSTPKRRQALRRERSASPPTAPMPAFDGDGRRRGRAADGIEAVAIVTPNHMHFGPAKAFLEGRHPRHLRQAADDDARRRAGAGRGEAEERPRSSC